MSCYRNCAKTESYSTPILGAEKLGEIEGSMDAKANLPFHRLSNSTVRLNLQLSSAETNLNEATPHKGTVQRSLTQTTQLVFTRGIISQ